MCYIHVPMCHSRITKGARSSNVTTVRAALRCMCMLLDAHPGFNYASDLLQLIVSNMAHRAADLAAMCCGAVERLLGGDVLGQLSLEAVQLVADLVKKRNCVALRPMVLTSLFALQVDALQGPVGMGMCHIELSTPRNVLMDNVQVQRRPSSSGRKSPSKRKRGTTWTMRFSRPLQPPIGAVNMVVNDGQRACPGTSAFDCSPKPSRPSLRRCSASSSTRLHRQRSPPPTPAPCRPPHFAPSSPCFPQRCKACSSMRTSLTLTTLKAC